MPVAEWEYWSSLDIHDRASPDFKLEKKMPCRAKALQGLVSRARGALFCSRNNLAKVISEMAGAAQENSEAVPMRLLGEVFFGDGAVPL